VSRRRKALLATAFTYGQWVVAVLTGLVITRFLLHRLGAELYGTWLATGALLAYASLADLGILGVMPWLVAEADGAQDQQRLRLLASHGLAAALVGMAIYLVTAFVLWQVLPTMIHLAPADREVLRGPIIAMVLITALGYPLRVGTAIRQGLQDYSFIGRLNIVQTVANFALVVGLGLAGEPLYGVALGVTLPALVSNALLTIRAVANQPSLFSSWTLNWQVLRTILYSGSGQWLGSIGWQLAFASDAVVIGYLGFLGLVPVFAVTSRLGLTLMQLSWVLPDSSMVGLAQLNAEGGRARVGEVVEGLLRFHLFTAGLIACGLLAGNSGFVSAWVGHSYFGGPVLNLVFAIDVVVLSTVHGLVVPVGALGKRLTIGFLTAANGLVHIALALMLGRWLGLPGVALATAASGLLTSIPVGLVLLTQMTTLSRPGLGRAVLLPWALRAVPCLGFAVAAGAVVTRPGLVGDVAHPRAWVLGILTGVLAGAVYLLSMRAVVRDLPLGPRLRRALLSLRLV
jgi:O-antigen/teichoic acid export membrane protein